jgi:hypothetical protein
MDAWQSPVRPNLRTSLIVDPPDGKIPPLTPEGQKPRPAAARRMRPPRCRPAAVRALLNGQSGPPRLPLNHDSESQIVGADTAR